MDNAATASEMSHIPAPTAVAVQAPVHDDLAFFQALWFWIPAALALWSLLIWAVAQLI
jgi:hypothetical protein